jgi:hypothetical protein
MGRFGSKTRAVANSVSDRNANIYTFADAAYAHGNVYAYTNAYGNSHANGDAYFA